MMSETSFQRLFGTLDDSSSASYSIECLMRVGLLFCKEILCFRDSICYRIYGSTVANRPPHCPSTHKTTFKLNWLGALSSCYVYLLNPFINPKLGSHHLKDMKTEYSVGPQRSGFHECAGTHIALCTMAELDYDTGRPRLNRTSYNQCTGTIDYRMIGGQLLHEHNITPYLTHSRHPVSILHF